MELKDRHVELFHAKVDRSGPCWLWTGELNNQGYGRAVLYHDGTRTRVLAHRMAFLIATGLDPVVVRHDCDTPRCVRPDHLRPGTQADNMQDAKARGRLNLTGFEEYSRRRDQLARDRAALPTKTCTRCKTEKSKDAFFANRAELDGRSHWCKACLMDRQRESRALKRERRDLKRRQRTAVAA